MKSIKSVPYLYKRDGVFYFRRSVPLEAISGSMLQEFKLSLRTSHLGKAKYLCREIASGIDGALRVADMVEVLTREQILEMVRDHFLLSLQQQSELITHADTRKKLSNQESYHKKRQESLQRSFLKRDYTTIIEKTKQVLKRSGIHGIAEYQGEGPDYSALLESVLRAEIETSRILMEKARGNWSMTNPQDPLFSEVQNRGKFLVPLADRQKSNSPQVAALIEQFSTFKDVGQDSIREKQMVMNYFMDLVGDDLRVNEIDAQIGHRFRDAIIKLPTNINKKSEFNGKSLNELIELPSSVQRISSKTAHKYFGYFKGFLNWCEQEGHIKHNPVKTLNIVVKKADEKKRIPFSSKGLTSLFCSPQYVGHDKKRSVSGPSIIKDSRFWLPLLALYTGARLGELVQLLCSDVKLSEGKVWYFDISSGNGVVDKTFKTESSERYLPIHNELFKLGFLDFVKSQKNKYGEASLLFTDFKSKDTQKMSTNAGKRFSTYMEAIGLKEDGLVFHSFRHTMADGLSRVNVSESKIKAILGHSQVGVTFQNYKNTFSPDELVGELNKVKFDVDLSHLYPEK